MTLDGRPAFPIDKAAIREPARGFWKRRISRPERSSHSITAKGVKNFLHHGRQPKKGLPDRARMPTTKPSVRVVATLTLVPNS